MIKSNILLETSATFYYIQVRSYRKSPTCLTLARQSGRAGKHTPYVEGIRMKIASDPHRRNQLNQENIGVHLAASELSEPEFSAWLSDPWFTVGFRQAFRLGGTSSALSFASTWINDTYTQSEPSILGGIANARV